MLISRSIKLAVLWTAVLALHIGLTYSILDFYKIPTFDLSIYVEWLKRELKPLLDGSKRA